MDEKAVPFKPFIPHYDPQDWYWLHPDGRVYSSAKRTNIPAGDKTYQDWLNAGNKPTHWPKDDDGLQTDESLHDVLSLHGIVVSMKSHRESAIKKISNASVKSFSLEDIARMIADHDAAKTMLSGATSSRDKAISDIKEAKYPEDVDKIVNDYLKGQE